MRAHNVVRVGLPDAFISVDIVDALGKQLTNPGEMVRGYAAIAIGYLTFNPIAKRQTLNMLATSESIVSDICYFLMVELCSHICLSVLANF